MLVEKVIDRVIKLQGVNMHIPKPHSKTPVFYIDERRTIIEKSSDVHYGHKNDNVFISFNVKTDLLLGFGEIDLTANVEFVTDEEAKVEEVEWDKREGVLYTTVWLDNNSAYKTIDEDETSYI